MLHQGKNTARRLFPVSAPRACLTTGSRLVDVERGLRGLQRARFNVRKEACVECAALGDADGWAASGGEWRRQDSPAVVGNSVFVVDTGHATFGRQFELNDDGDDSSTGVVDSGSSVYYNDARRRA
ncbi:unnamed protein product [Chrysodeixis includens]|uniref:Uncharacterized protein n=1 Tax=Chrysodeixis includens TaxID=689277 RepID=A0A9N8KPJ7_CHRIL|nr:unnamed protein product [Chrysodeixis includens]